MRLKELKIFVEENKDHPKLKSKIGWRATYDGKLYGDQICTTPPSEAELVEVINLFLGQAIGCLEVLESEPTADVIEVRHGEWREVNEKYPRYVCTACSHLFNNKNYNYCPCCGAKMDGERKEQG